METIIAAIAAFAKGETNKVVLEDLRTVDPTNLKIAFEFWRTVEAPNAAGMLRMWDDCISCKTDDCAIHRLTIEVQIDGDNRYYSYDVMVGPADSEYPTHGWGLM